MFLYLNKQKPTQRYALMSVQFNVSTCLVTEVWSSDLGRDYLFIYFLVS